jgi:hypothetical protein
MDLPARKRAMIKPAYGPAFHFILWGKGRKIIVSGWQLFAFLLSPQVLLTLAYEFKLVNGTTILPGSR